MNETAGQSSGAAASPATILLVDDEANILSSLNRLLRRDGYRILTANGGEAGLAVLAEQAVDVIVSDQRMPNMTGVEFLRRAKELYPETVRIVLSGYTELQSISDAINEGAIYKFMTKPWDDDLLRETIREAFRQKGLADENRRLTVELGAANQQLQQLLAEQQKQLQDEQVVLRVMQEILQAVPLPIIGLDDDGLIVCTNQEADRLFGGGASLIGSFAQERLPAELLDLADGTGVWFSDGVEWQARYQRIGDRPGVGGRLLILAR